MEELQIKTCSSCRKAKPTSEFAGDKRRPDGLTCQCKACIRESKRRYRQTAKGKATERRYQQSEKGKSCRRNIDLRRNFGINTEDYNAMFEQQKGCCKLCGVHQNKLSYRLHVDHNHITGKVRGLLCKPCNSKLGWLENRREQILHYLTSH